MAILNGDILRECDIENGIPDNTLCEPEFAVRPIHRYREKSEIGIPRITSRAMDVLYIDMIHRA